MEYSGVLPIYLNKDYLSMAKRVTASVAIISIIYKMYEFTAMLKLRLDLDVSRRLAPLDESYNLTK